MWAARGVTHSFPKCPIPPDYHNPHRIHPPPTPDRSPTCCSSFPQFAAFALWSPFDAWTCGFARILIALPTRAQYSPQCNWLRSHGHLLASGDRQRHACAHLFHSTAPHFQVSRCNHGSTARGALVAPQLEHKSKAVARDEKPSSNQRLAQWLKGPLDGSYFGLKDLAYQVIHRHN
jgi:hypothetical protein